MCMYILYHDIVVFMDIEIIKLWSETEAIVLTSASLVSKCTHITYLFLTVMPPG